MKTRAVFAITLAVRSPFLFRALTGAMLGVDAAQLRDQDGCAIIPSDQVRGVLRQALNYLGEAAPAVIAAGQIETLLGNLSPKQGSPKYREPDEPDRSSLIFSDLRAAGCDGGAVETTRIEIDEETGAVKTGHVQVIELAAPYGAEVAFEGEIVAFADPGTLDALKEALGKALAIIPAIGAYKSAGFGEIVHEQSGIDFKEGHALAMPAAAPRGDLRRAYWVTFDRPILVDAARVADNTFLGSAIIPGSTFKGALAQRLAYAGEDPEHGTYSKALSGIRFSHAFPEARDGRPSGAPFPLSLVGLKSSNMIGDALDVPYGKGAQIDGESPLFVADWKPGLSLEAEKRLGWPHYEAPEPMARTHTAIDEEGVAAEEQLYTTVALSVLRPEGWAEPGPRRWLFVADGSRVEDQEKCAQLFALLEQGLEPLGKTNARAKLTPAGSAIAALPCAIPIHGRETQFTVVLKTPAIIADALGDGDVQEQYERYFREQCPAAALKSFFASQRLAGGYHATRRRPYGSAYYPFVLTEPGSVFLLEAESGAANAVQERLSDLARDGLPLPPLKHAASLNWRNCPFVPENGFGEIAVDYLSDASTASLLERVTHA